VAFPWDVSPTGEQRVEIVGSMIWSELPWFGSHGDQAERGCCCDKMADEELMMAADMNLGSCLGIGGLVTN
jgi:hypothetical protein